MELRLGFLVSGKGSNFESILDSIDSGELKASPRVLVSSQPKAKALEIARDRNLPSCCLNSENTKDLDEAIIETLHEYDVNLVVLAGYLKKIGDNVLNKYPNRILNVHPALLPKYGGKDMYGMKVHEAVIASDDRESGATVHLVTSDYDAGKILAQYKVPRYPRDTARTLSERVLRIEHVCYVQTLKAIQEDIIDLDSETIF